MGGDRMTAQDALLPLDVLLQRTIDLVEEGEYSEAAELAQHAANTLIALVDVLRSGEEPRDDH